MRWWPRKLKAAAEPDPDPSDDDSEPDAKLKSIPAIPKVQFSFRVSSHHLNLSKYRDPLLEILDYITEVRVVGTSLTIPLCL
jgi:hypothetical protein